ncbi:MAG: hydrogenase-1 expression HyaE [Thiotrichales bacterium]
MSNVATASPNQPVITPSPLIDRLSEALGYPLLDLDGVTDFLPQHDFSVLFFTEDIKRFPESNDVAVVLPELISAFPELSPAVVARKDEKKLQKQFGFTSWPALVFFREGQYLGALTGIQDWNVYLSEIKSMLASEPSRPPTVGIPVVPQ